MESARKIVNIEDAKPLARKGGRTKAAIAAAVIVVAGVGIAIAFKAAGTKEAPAIKGYDVAEVQAMDLASSSDASGTVIVPVKIAVASPQTGYADEVLVVEGDSVAKGQLLATLDVPDLVESRDDYKAQLAVARLQLEDLRTDYDYQIKSLETSISRLDDQIDDATVEVATQKALAALKSSKQSDYDNAVASLESLRQKREDAAASLELQKAKRTVGLAKQEATIRQLEVSLGRVQDDISAAAVKSPMAGDVISVSDELGVPGTLIEKYATLMTIANRKETYVDLSVPDQYAGLLSVGQTLTATVGATTITAKITSIGKTASLASDGLTAMVSVRAKPDDQASLTPGAAVVASIPLGVKKGALTLPRGAYLTTGSQKWVYKVDGDVARKVAVEFGEIQGTRVEVKKGLSAGDRIVSSGYQDFIDSDLVSLK